MLPTVAGQKEDKEKKRIINTPVVCTDDTRSGLVVRKEFVDWDTTHVYMGPQIQRSHLFHLLRQWVTTVFDCREHCWYLQ